MKITLVQCPAFGIDRPPLGLAYLVAFLRRYKHQATVFDLNVELYSRTKEEDKKFWEFQYVFEWMENNHIIKQKILPSCYFKKWAQRILSSNPDLIGFSVQSSSLTASISLAGEIKSICPEQKIVFGGPLHLSYSLDHSYYLLGIENLLGVKTIDVVVLGEGESTIIDVVQRIESKNSLIGCPGTIIRENNRMFNNGERRLIEDIDSIPFPEFNDFPEKYKFKDRLPILGSRGCVNRCVFCDDTLMWRRYRYRSAKNILAEIRLRKDNGIEFLEFNDLLINGNLSQLSGLCDLLIKENINISWGASATVDKQMDYKLFRKMKQSGCCYLNYGIESASPRVLRQMNKNFMIEEAKKIIKDTYRAGIAVCTNWIVGFPTETEKDFNQTLEFVSENMMYLKNNIMVNSFILKSSSLLFRHKQRFGIVADDQRNWHSQNGNHTTEIRKKRYEKFIELISALGDVPAHKTFQK